MFPGAANRQLSILEANFSDRISTRMSNFDKTNTDNMLIIIITVQLINLNEIMLLICFASIEFMVHLC